MLGLKARVVLSPVGTIEEALSRPYGTDAGGNDSPSTEVLGYCHAVPTARETQSSQAAKKSNACGTESTEKRVCDKEPGSTAFDKPRPRARRGELAEVRKPGGNLE